MKRGVGFCLRHLAYEDAVMNTLNLLSFQDLQTKRIANNRTQLSRLVKNHGFPPGFLLSANSRRWPEDEVAEWLEAQRAKSKAGAS
jgi:predicted DNA-binding transcriptional regulator AlpA